MPKLTGRKNYFQPLLGKISYLLSFKGAIDYTQKLRGSVSGFITLVRIRGRFYSNSVVSVLTSVVKRLRVKVDVGVKITARFHGIKRISAAKANSNSKLATIGSVYRHLTAKAIGKIKVVILSGARRRVAAHIKAGVSVGLPKFYYKTYPMDTIDILVLELLDPLYLDEVAQSLHESFGWVRTRRRVKQTISAGAKIKVSFGGFVRDFSARIKSQPAISSLPSVYKRILGFADSKVAVKQPQPSALRRVTSEVTATSKLRVVGKIIHDYFLSMLDPYFLSEIDNKNMQDIE